ncbi:MAG TPA: hypothetical protein VKB67_00105 [Rhizomicrobium sp.]|nr:hypothetical protein [Rhizomicrobium sp.]
MRLTIVGILALVSLAGCTEYPATLQNSIAQAVPPYHQAAGMDLDTASGMIPVESDTHNSSIRPFPH